MKLYQMLRNLSRDTWASVGGLLCVVCVVVDLRALPCFVGMVAGVEMTSDKSSLAWFFVVQVAVLLLCASLEIARLFKRARAPRRQGVIPPEMIREILGAER